MENEKELTAIDMAYDKWKIEAGQGGKVGHSNMAHWDYSESIKESSKALRRLESKKILENLDLKHLGFCLTIQFSDSAESSDIESVIDTLIISLESEKILITGHFINNIFNASVDLSSSILLESNVVDIINSELKKSAGVVCQLIIKECT